MSYNVLCERCATERIYGYTPSWAQTWKYRKDLILEEVKRKKDEAHAESTAMGAAEAVLGDSE